MININDKINIFQNGLAFLRNWSEKLNLILAGLASDEFEGGNAESQDGAQEPRLVRRNFLRFGKRNGGGSDLGSDNVAYMKRESDNGPGEVYEQVKKHFVHSWFDTSLNIFTTILREMLKLLSLFWHNISKNLAILKCIFIIGPGNPVLNSNLNLNDVINCRPSSGFIRIDRVREVSSDSVRDLHFRPCSGPSPRRWPFFRWSKTTSTRSTRSPTRPRSWRRCWWRSEPTIFWDSENDFWQNKIWRIESSSWHSTTRPWTRGQKISSDSAKLDRFLFR